VSHVARSLSAKGDVGDAMEHSRGGLIARTAKLLLKEMRQIRLGCEPDVDPEAANSRASDA